MYKYLIKSQRMDFFFHLSKWDICFKQSWIKRMSVLYHTGTHFTNLQNTQFGPQSTLVHTKILTQAVWFIYQMAPGQRI